MVERELGKVAENHKTFDFKLKEVEAKSDQRLIRFKNLLLKQACMNKVLRGVFEQYVSVFEGTVNRLCGYLLN